MGIKLYKKEKGKEFTNEEKIKVQERLINYLLSAAFDKIITRRDIGDCSDNFIKKLLEIGTTISVTRVLPLGDVLEVISENMTAITGGLFSEFLELNDQEMKKFTKTTHKKAVRNTLKFKQACLKNFGTGDESCKNLIRKFEKEIEKFEQEIKELHGKINN